MNLGLSIEPGDFLVVHLQEGSAVASVSVHPSKPGMQSLQRAVDAAVDHGYGECFWPGSPGGQHWWIFKRDAETVEIVAMWTRGGASSWEHVFRATDAMTWVQERVRTEVARLRALSPAEED